MEGESTQHERGLWEKIFSRENLQAALKRVRENKGAPGVDGMRVEELPSHLKEHWVSILKKLEEGKGCVALLPRREKGSRLT
jgi:RNA-directed DNA polymerase